VRLVAAGDAATQRLDGHGARQRFQGSFRLSQMTSAAAGVGAAGVVDLQADPRLQGVVGEIAAFHGGLNASIRRSGGW